MLNPIIALLITIFLWASAFVGIRYGLSFYTPGAIALFRLILASLLMGALFTNILQKKTAKFATVKR